MPKYVSSCPVVQGVGLNSVAVPGRVPVIANELGAASLSGTRISTTKSPVPGPGDTVKPQLMGGLLDVGLLVPLSIHWLAQYPCRGSNVVSAWDTATHKIRLVSVPIAIKSFFFVTLPPPWIS